MPGWSGCRASIRSRMAPPSAAGHRSCPRGPPLRSAQGHKRSAPRRRPGTSRRAAPSQPRRRGCDGAGPPAHSPERRPPSPRSSHVRARSAAAPRVRARSPATPAAARRRERRHQRIRTLADRHAPPGHRAVGLRLGDGGEGLLRPRIVEGMQHRDRTTEPLLRRRAAGNREGHPAEILAGRVLPVERGLGRRGLGRHRQRRQQQAGRGQQDRAQHPADRLVAKHGNLPSLVVGHARGRLRGRGS